MADIATRLPENATGKYYVDSSCECCGTCSDLAPDNFETGDAYSFVKKQPENSIEEHNCSEAMESCPFDAIGDNWE